MGGLRCGQALVWVENSGEGRGGLLRRLCSGICGRPSAAWGLCPLALSGSIPPFYAPPRSLLFPFPAVGLQAAVTSVGFLQPGLQLVQLRHLLPGPLSQSHLPGEEPAPYSSSRLSVGSPLLAAHHPRVFGWFLGVLQVNRSLRSRPWRCCGFRCPWALGDGLPGSHGRMTRFPTDALFAAGLG